MRFKLRQPVALARAAALLLLGPSLFVLLGAASSATATPLIAAWELDGAPTGSLAQTAVDSGPNGFDGVLGDTAAVEATDPTRFTEGAVKGMSFSAVPTYVLGPADPLLEPAQVTVELRARGSAPAGSSGSLGNFRYLLSKPGLFSAAYGLTTGGDGGIHFQMEWGSSSTAKILPGIGPSPSGPWDGQWHEFIGSYDGQRAQLWVDGTMVQELAFSSPVPFAYNPGAPLRIGALNGAGGSFSSENGFIGDIDYVHLYDQALTPTEIQALSVPEPGTLLLVAFGLGALAGRRHGWGGERDLRRSG